MDAGAIAAAVAAVAGLVIGFAAAWGLHARQAAGALEAALGRQAAQMQRDIERLGQDKGYAEQRLQEAHERIQAFERQVREVTGQRDELRTELAALKSTSDNRSRRIDELTAERDAARDEAGQLRDTKASLETKLQKQAAEFEEQRKAMDEKLALLDNAEKQLNQQFENLANRIFETKSESFRKTSSEQLSHLLKPFRDQIDNLHRDVREAGKERHTLRTQIEKIVTEANALTNALKGDSRRQGAWGELVLERILENSGLRRGEEYEVQASYTGEDGKRLRPDVIVHLPEERDIVIDSKVSLTAYERHVNADDETERAAQLKAHVQSVRSHVEQLAAKRYDHIKAIRTLDYTLMWIPIEPAYFAAMQAEPALFESALARRVLPVTATTLFAVLKTIERIWQYERQNRNVQSIVNRASSLYDKFVNFTDAMDKLGSHLERAQKSYGDARGRLLEGPGNVVRQIEQLREMGLTPKKRLPADWVQTAGALSADKNGDEGDEVS